MTPRLHAGSSRLRNRDMRLRNTTLGYKFAQGDGVSKDTGEAIRWLREAAGQGHAAAQYRLGAMYFNDKEPPADKAEAARWYRLAAEQGHAGAKERLREYQETYGPAPGSR